MIDIKNPEDCCGCRACVQACPKQCIAFEPDAAEGFGYPKVDLSLCIDCHLCERVCPMLDKSGSSEPLKVLAAANPDRSVRMDSSSGGFFSMLAEDVISRGGSVFGVAMDAGCRSASHIEVTDSDSLAFLRGSKYLQASTGSTFADVRRRLIDGKPVLYSGTPCQIHGLRLFLGKKLSESPLLLLVDVVCHGTPSPEAWRAYLNWRAAGSPVYGVNFRDKTESGWRSFGVSLRLTPYDLQPSGEARLAGPDGPLPHAGQPGVVSECHRSDLFMRSFLSNVNLRPSCYNCPSNAGRSGSDITLADFWGLPQSEAGDDNSGISQLLVRTRRGAEALASLHLADVREYPYSRVLAANPCAVRSVARPDRRAYFWKYYRTDFPRAVRASAPPVPLILRLKIKAAALLGKLGIRR